MDTGEALLKAILAAPEEDAPRLVYADWLQEQGDEERAGLIRRMCASPRETLLLNGVGELGWSCGGASLLAPWDCLMREADRVFPPPHPRATSNVLVAVRGFFTEVTCTAADWLTHADALTAAHPVREVTLTTYPVLSLEWVTTYRDGSTWHVAKWPGVTFHLPPEPRRDQYAHWAASVRALGGRVGRNFEADMLAEWSRQTADPTV